MYKRQVFGSSLQGDTTFSVPLTSSGGHSLDASFTVNVGPDSTISYNSPTGLKVGRNQTLEINVLEHASEANPSNYSVSCGDATGVDNSKLVGVSHSGSSCTFTVDPIDGLGSSLQGDTTFSVPLTSTGGHTLDASFTVNVGPDSTITYTAPTGLKVGRNQTLEINVLDHATEANPSDYAISCGDATGVENVKLSGVTHSGSSCTFTVDPIDTLASSLQGGTAFSVPLTSTGGDTTSATFTVYVGPDSDITVTLPSSCLLYTSPSPRD